LGGNTQAELAPTRHREGSRRERGGRGSYPVWGAGQNRRP